MCYTDCFNTPAKIKQELSTAEIKHIMDELFREGCLELTLTGGEPFSRPDFFEIYEYAKEKGFLITLFTNGTLITEMIADRLAAYPPYRIEISVHGMKQKTFDQVTQQKGSSEKVWRAVDLLLERNLNVLLKTTPMTLNSDEIWALKHYVEEKKLMLKIGEGMRRDLTGSDAPLELALDEEEFQAFVRGDSEVEKEYCRKQSAVARPCEKGKFEFHIDAYGGLQLCSGNRRKTYDLRSGSFKEGFHDYLPEFPCPYKVKYAMSHQEATGGK